MEISIFELDSLDFTCLILRDPDAIYKEIGSRPMAFILEAPLWILADPRYQTFAIRNFPGLRYLLNEDGTTDLTDEHWHNAMRANPNLVWMKQIPNDVIIRIWLQRNESGNYFNNEFDQHMFHVIYGKNFAE